MRFSAPWSDPFVRAKARTQSWIPACAGMSGGHFTAGSLNGSGVPSGSGMRKTLSVIDISA
jgi:hypothetical protein